MRPYIETRQPHEGDTTLYAKEVHEYSVSCVFTLRLGSLTKAMKVTQSPMPRKSMSTQ